MSFWHQNVKSCLKYQKICQSRKLYVGLSHIAPQNLMVNDVHHEDWHIEEIGRGVSSILSHACAALSS